ncbi:hypothetical protein THAOC_03383, partial [Thalassiosira oceanica]
TQASNDSGLGARTDVLGEVKTLQPSKNSYDKGNCQTNRPVNLRATQAVRSYRRRAAGLDQKYAQEVVGDGTNGQVGPFETALGEFYTGNVLPVAVGAFSEVNEDASKLITRLARLTAKTDFGKSMSPLVSHSRKGGAHSQSCSPSSGVPSDIHTPYLSAPLATIYFSTMDHMERILRSRREQQHHMVTIFLIVHQFLFSSSNILSQAWAVRQGMRTTRHLHLATTNEDGSPPAIATMPTKKTYTRPGVEAAARLVSLGIGTGKDCIGHWDRAVVSYPTAVKAKGGPKLVKLDKQREGIAKRWASIAKGNRYLSKEQLLDVVIPWKFSMGKPRNALKPKLNSNSDEAVMHSTQRAFAVADELQPQGGGTEDREEFASSLNEVCQLCGVGPATASAVLSLYRPDSFAFMADEVIEVLYEGKRGYTIKIYRDINAKCANIARELNAAAEVNSWTPAKVGEALWSVAALAASGENETLARVFQDCGPGDKSKRVAGSLPNNEENNNAKLGMSRRGDNKSKRARRR